MKRLIVWIAIIALSAPAITWAQKSQPKSPPGKHVDEYGEEYVDPSVVEQVPPPKPAASKKKAAPVEEADVGAGPGGTAPKPKKEARPAPAYSPTASGRDGRFRVGFVGPGVAVISRGYGAAMTAGIEGEYFFFEKLSAGLRFEVATKFKSPTWLSIVPRARYVFDLDNHPRWAIYAQAGVGAGISAGGGSYAACDIALPGGGFWWQWTDRFSIGADTNLHIFARSDVAVGWTFAPVVRYIFGS